MTLSLRLIFWGPLSTLTPQTRVQSTRARKRSKVVNLSAIAERKLQEGHWLTDYVSAKCGVFF